MLSGEQFFLSPSMNRICCNSLVVSSLPSIVSTRIAALVFHIDPPWGRFAIFTYHCDFGLVGSSAEVVVGFNLSVPIGIAVRSLSLLARSAAHFLEQHILLS
jgi:hypothetical protein